MSAATAFGTLDLIKSEKVLSDSKSSIKGTTTTRNAATASARPAVDRSTTRAFSIPNTFTGIPHPNHKNGIIPGFIISTRTPSPTKGPLPAGSVSDSSSRRSGLGHHLMNEVPSSAMHSTSMGPKERVAAAACRRDQEEKERKAISQKRLRTANARKRLLPNGGPLGRESAHPGGGAKRLKREVAGSRLSTSGKQVKCMDLTQDSDDEAVVKVKVEAGEGDGGLDLQSLSTRDLEDRLLAVRLRLELRAREIAAGQAGSEVSEAGVKREQ